MKKTPKTRSTTVGNIDQDILWYTAGRDAALDMALVEADCIGTAAHVTMLANMPVTPRLFSAADLRRIIAELTRIMRRHAKGAFTIRVEDQDVHLAVERTLTQALGDLGKRVHTARSRNDQVAVDLRLFAKTQLLYALDEATALGHALVVFARRHAAVPMVGRTHMQPAMPGSVGLWAGAHAESLLDDMAILMNAYALNDQCPLGSAASYGVPLPIDRQLTSDLLGFSRPIHNVLYANNARGKMEAVILAALTQIMLTLSRLAQDLILFSMPEFAYFSLPAELCTGSSIMPQKKNPDVMELVRAKAARVAALSLAVTEIIRAAPSGYNRDLQEAKEPFMEGLATTRASLRIMKRMVDGLEINEPALIAAFTPDVFATDYALELVAQGKPFRDAYHYVKAHLDELTRRDPVAAVAAKTHLGAPAGLDFEETDARLQAAGDWVSEERQAFHTAVSDLLGTHYPLQ